MSSIKILTVKRKWVLWAILFIFSLTLTYLWWVVIQFYRDYESIPSHHLIGNRLSNVAALKEEGVPFSFLVVGDTRGSETAETLIEMALKKDRSSFMVILGDFVKKPDLWNHRFFLTEMTAEINPSFPVFLVPGNHDIDYKNSIKPMGRKVTPEVYESLYGARNFDFIFNDCLFIICGVDPKSPALYLEYLREALNHKGKERKHIFVFIHFPPKGLADYIEGSLPIPGEEEFFRLLEDHRVTACFFGDYHGYWRGQRKGVNLIVSGGGGHLKPSQPEWGKFHHILKITVEPQKFVEEVITVQEQYELEDVFEEWIFTSLLPVIHGSAWILHAILIVFLAMSGFLFSRLLITIRRG